MQHDGSSGVASVGKEWKRKLNERIKDEREEKVMITGAVQ